MAVNGSSKAEEFPNPLNGRHMRVFMNYETPFVLKPADCPEVQYPTPMRPNCLQGLVIDLLLVMARRLNFTYTLYFPADKAWGAVDANGSWNGIIKHILQDDGDLIVASMTIHTGRLSAVDFSSPFHFTGRGFMLLDAAPPPSYFRFIEPFTRNVWYAFLVSLAVVTTLVNITNKLSPFDFHGHFIYNTDIDAKQRREMEKFRLATYRRYKKEAIAKLDVGNSFWSAIATVFHENGSGYNDSYSGRLILGCWWILGLILIQTYTANMTAWLTQARLEGRIETVADLLNNPSYTYGIQGGTGTMNSLRNMKGEAYKTIFRNMQENDWVLPNDAAGTAKVQAGKFAYFLPRSTIHAYNNRQPCNTRMAAEVFDKVFYGIGMQKGALWLKAINAFVLRVIEDGTITALEHKWFVEKGECQHNVVVENDGRMRPEDMIGVLMVIYGSMVVGALVLACERWQKRWARNRRRKTERLAERVARRYISPVPDSIRPRMYMAQR